ncbi:ABC transporter substrate-binding protein [Fluviispira vulneris]|uniref:ABC transporter substrate-binding protein n=1 Tax=Fluviispira vulneris TaxID=2763012 RepID=UPI0016440010|nr:ABC transporter substrate binding protein [Fluviispira vulneris]
MTFGNNYKKSISDYLSPNYILSYHSLQYNKNLKIKNEEYLLNTLEYINKFKPDLVILVDELSLRILSDKLNHAKIPTVFLGLKKDPSELISKDFLYITGVYAKPLVLETASYLKQVLPKTKRALILLDRSRSSEILYEEILKNINNNFIFGIHFQVERIENYLNWQAIVLNSKKNYDVIIAGYYQSLKSDLGSQIDADEVIKWSSKNSPTPIFGLWDNSVGKDKAIAGIVVSQSNQAYQAAKLAEKILIHPRVLPKSIPPVYLEKGSIIFSKFQLKKWKIKLSKNLVHDAYFVE